MPEVWKVGRDGQNFLSGVYRRHIPVRIIPVDHFRSFPGRVDRNRSTLPASRLQGIFVVDKSQGMNRAVITAAAGIVDMGWFFRPAIFARPCFSPPGKSAGSADGVPVTALPGTKIRCPSVPPATGNCSRVEREIARRCLFHDRPR